MAIDTAQKRMSAMNPASPWRGPLVDATEVGFSQGNRQAANFMYSGILAVTIVIIPVCVTLSSAITDPKIVFNITTNPVILSNADNPVSLSDEECV